MPILNYTTKVPVDRTLAEIQKILMKIGVRGVLTQYDQSGCITSLSFQTEFNGQLLAFKLPCNWEVVLKILEREKVAPRERTKEQAMRVAWRIMKDWIEAQVALIQTEMVKTEQVFLPYIVTQSGQTLYENFVDNPHLLLKAP